MSDLITQTQERYLLALLESMGQARYENLRGQLDIPAEVSISQLTKEEAYKLITRLVTESSPVAVEKALAAALAREE